MVIDTIHMEQMRTWKILTLHTHLHRLVARQTSIYMVYIVHLVLISTSLVFEYKQPIDDFLADSAVILHMCDPVMHLVLLLSQLRAFLALVF